MNVLLYCAPLFAKSGYGKQGYLIAKQLRADGHTVINRGTTVKGSEIEYDGFKILPNIPSYTTLDNSLTEQIRRHDIKMILTLIDPWVFQRDLIRGVRDLGCYFVPYAPLDKETIPTQVIQVFRESTAIVTMSNYGYELTQRVSRGIESQLGVQMPHLRNIPHSIDTETFVAHPKYREKFIVGDVKVNAGERPNFPILFEAFKRFVDQLKLKPADVELHLHTNPMPTEETQPDFVGYNLYLLALTYGINEYVTFPNDWNHTLDISDDVMARDVYSQFDVFVNPSSGEGFGLTNVEAEACNVPTLVTGGCGAQLELTPEECHIPVAMMQMSKLYAREPIPSAKALGEMLVSLYEDDKRRKELGAAGREIAKKYDSKSILPQWTHFMYAIESHVKTFDMLKWGGYDARYRFANQIRNSRS